MNVKYNFAKNGKVKAEDYPKNETANRKKVTENAVMLTSNSIAHNGLLSRLTQQLNSAGIPFEEVDGQLFIEQDGDAIIISDAGEMFLAGCNPEVPSELRYVAELGARNAADCVMAIFGIYDDIVENCDVIEDDDSDLTENDDIDEDTLAENDAFTATLTRGNLFKILDNPQEYGLLDDNGQRDEEMIDGFKNAITHSLFRYSKPERVDEWVNGVLDGDVLLEDYSIDELERYFKGDIAQKELISATADNYDELVRARGKNTGIRNEKGERVAGLDIATIQVVVEAAQDGDTEAIEQLNEWFPATEKQRNFGRAEGLEDDDFLSAMWEGVVGTIDNPAIDFTKVTTVPEFEQKIFDARQKLINEMRRTNRPLSGYKHRRNDDTKDDYVHTEDVRLDAPTNEGNTTIGDVISSDANMRNWLNIGEDAFIEVLCGSYDHGTGEWNDTGIGDFTELEAKVIWDFLNTNGKKQGISEVAEAHSLPATEVVNIIQRFVDSGLIDSLMENDPDNAPKDAKTAQVANRARETLSSVDDPIITVAMYIDELPDYWRELFENAWGFGGRGNGGQGYGKFNSLPNRIDPEDKKVVNYIRSLTDDEGTPLFRQGGVFTAITEDNVDDILDEIDGIIAEFPSIGQRAEVEINSMFRNWRNLHLTLNSVFGGITKKKR